MTVFYDGVDCLADQGSDLYNTLKNESSAQVNYYRQADYALYCVYFGVVAAAIILFKNVIYKVRDKRVVQNGFENISFMGSIIDVTAAYCRLVSYRPTPLVLTKVLSFPRSLAQTLFAVASAIFLFCVCLIPHFWYRGCKGFGSPPLAIRAGCMATALLPFIFSLSGKYSFVSLISGIGYEKLNWLHQFVGLACLVLALIHAIPFIHQPLMEGGLLNLAEVYSNDDDMQHGVPTLVCLFILVVLFNRHIRKYLYEISFHIHWIVGCAFFAFLMNHVYGMLDMQNYLWATLAIWAVQWVYRVSKSGLASVREAEIVKIGDKSMQITVFNVKRYSWSCGQHCFLRFPGARIFDNHPFSVASINEDDYMRFVIVPRKGLTKKLYEQLDEQIQKKRVFVDGPYGGCSRNPLSFDRVFLFSTGGGITGTLPYLTQLSKKMSALRVDLFWVVRSYDDLEIAKSEIESSLEMANERVQVHIYIANQFSVNEKKIAIEGADVIHGKPNFGDVVSSLRSGLHARNMFVTCGNSSMGREVAQGVADLQSSVLRTGDASVQEVFLHNEEFGW